MDRIRHTAPPTRRRIIVGSRLHAVVLATMAALLLSALVAYSPTAPDQTRTSIAEELVTMADDLAVRTVDDTCMDLAGDSPC